MSEIDHNARKFRYHVSWRRNDIADDWQQEIITDWRRDHLLIPNQPTYVPYRISVKAENELGESKIAPVEVIGYSGEDSKRGGIGLSHPTDPEEFRESTNSRLTLDCVPVITAYRITR